MKKEYFSKLYKKWMPLLNSDCEEKLRKYKYKIRVFDNNQNKKG